MDNETTEARVEKTEKAEWGWWTTPIKVEGWMALAQDFLKARGTTAILGITMANGEVIKFTGATWFIVDVMNQIETAMMHRQPVIRITLDAFSFQGVLIPLDKVISVKMLEEEKRQ